MSWPTCRHCRVLMPVACCFGGCHSAWLWIRARRQLTDRPRSSLLFKLKKSQSDFALRIKNRQSQLKGNPRLEVPPYDDKGDDLIGIGGSGGRPRGIEGYMWWISIQIVVPHHGRGWCWGCIACPCALHVISGHYYTWFQYFVDAWFSSKPLLLY